MESVFTANCAFVNLANNPIFEFATMDSHQLTKQYFHQDNHTTRTIVNSLYLQFLSDVIKTLKYELFVPQSCSFHIFEVLIDGIDSLRSLGKKAF